jgi:hypothetical protein
MYWCTQISPWSSLHSTSLNLRTLHIFTTVYFPPPPLHCIFGWLPPHLHFALFITFLTLFLKFKWGNKERIRREKNIWRQKMRRKRRISWRMRRKDSWWRKRIINKMRRRKKRTMTNKKGKLILDALDWKRRLYSFRLCSRTLLPASSAQRYCRRPDTGYASQSISPVVKEPASQSVRLSVCLPVSWSVS